MTQAECDGIIYKTMACLAKIEQNGEITRDDYIQLLYQEYYSSRNAGTNRFCCCCCC